MREADYKYNMNAAGGMSFRLSLPLGTNYTTERPCADGQFGNILKLYRDWKLSGDTEWLRELWPAAKRSLEYAWSPDNPDRWDPEQTGVLWGRQHHTLDMELFGPNSWLTGFYLGALEGRGRDGGRAGRARLRPTLLRAIYERGRAWVDAEPVQRRVLRPADRPRRPVGPRARSSRREVARRARRRRRAAVLEPEHKELKYQLGDGCLIDQALGQWHAGLYGLGDVLDPREGGDQPRSRSTATTSSERLGDIYNPCRVFGIDDEAGTVIATWPDGAAQAGGPGALRAGDDARHGVRLRPDADGLRHARRGRRGHGRQSATATTARSATPGTRSSAAPTMRARWRAGGRWSSLAGLQLRCHGAAISASRPRLRDGEVFRSFWSGANAYGTVRAAASGVTARVLGGDVRSAKPRPAAGRRRRRLRPRSTGGPSPFDGRRRRHRVLNGVDGSPPATCSRSTCRA